VATSGLNQPYGVAVDRTGDVFVADTGNNRVVEIPAGGGSQTTVGTGLNNPVGVAVDGAGDVFIVDQGNNRIVEVPVGGGTQTTVGTGLSSPQGVAVDGAGDVFIVDQGNNRVVEVLAGGGAQTIVVSGLNNPVGVAVDGAGDVFVADTGNNRILEIPAGGGAQTTVGTGLSSPQGVVVDLSGDVFIADTGNNRVLEVAAGGGAQTTVGTGLSSPQGVAVDTSGDVFIADAGNSRVVEIQRFAVNFGNVNICTGGQTTPPPCSQTLTLNYNINADITFGSNIKAVTQGAPNLDFTLSSTTCAGMISAGNSCTVNILFAPLAPGLRMGAAQLMDSSSNLLVTTFVHGLGQGPAIAFGSGTQTTVGSGLIYPQAVAVDAAGDVFIVDQSNNRVLEVPAGGGAQTTVGSGLLLPTAVAVDGAGDVFIAELGGSQVVEVPTGGGAQITVGSGLNSPYGLAVDGAGDVFISDAHYDDVIEVTAGSGAQTTVASGLNTPWGITVDGAGNLFIADASNNRVVEVPANGGAQITVGSGLNYPTGVAVDGAGNLFIADANNNRVVEVPANGGAQTAVGNGLNTPFGVAVDGAGDVFITEPNINQLVEVQRSQAPAFSFAATPVGNTSTDSPQSVTVQNIGNQPLAAVPPGLSVASNSFEQVAGSGTPADCTNSFSLTPGASCNLSISFIPQTTGGIVSAATFTDNALNSIGANQSITLQGTGVTSSVPVVSLNPSALSFASQPVGTSSASQSITVMNTGSVGLTLTSIAASGDFAQTNTCGANLVANTSCTINVTFAPTSMGPRSGLITISDNATNSPQTVPLSGTGLALVSISVAPSTVSATVGQVGQFMATGVYSDGSTLDVTAGVVWSAPNVAVASVSSAGQFTANGPGTTPIQASQGVISGFAQLNVVQYTPSYAYVLNQSSNDILVYSVDGNSGALTPVQGSPFPSGSSDPVSLATSPLGNSLFVANECVSSTDCSQGSVAVFSVNATTGNLTPIAGSPFPLGVYEPSSIGVTPSGNFVFVASQCATSSSCNQGGVVAVFASDPSTGALSPVPGSPFLTGGAEPSAASPSAVGSYIFVANECNTPSDCSQGTVSVLSMNNSTGGLTAVSGSPFAVGGAYVLSIGTSPSGGYVYTSDECLTQSTCSPGAISALAFNPATGSLTPLASSPYAPAGIYPFAVTASPNGNFVYAVDQCVGTSNCVQGQGGVSVFSVNPSTGALSLVPGSDFAAGQGTLGVISDPSGAFVYASNQSSGTISGFAVNQSNGTLASIPGSPFPAGVNPQKMAISGVKHSVVPTISSLQITPANTSLNLGQSQQLQLVANLIDGTVELLTASASWTSSSPNIVSLSGTTSGLVTGQEPGTTTITATVAGSSVSATVNVGAPVSRFGYVANDQDSTISGYEVDANVGALEPLPGSPFGAPPNPNHIYVNPGGNFAYATNDSGSLAGFSVDGVSGQLTPLPGSPLSLSVAPDHLVFHPSGKTAYVSKVGNNPPLAITLDPGSGQMALSTGTGILAADSVAVDSKGQYLYVGVPYTFVQTLIGYFNEWYYCFFGCFYHSGVFPYCLSYAYYCAPEYSDSGTYAYIYKYQLGSDGSVQNALNNTYLSTNPTQVNRMVVHPSGQFIYALYGPQNQIQLFTMAGTNYPTAGAITGVDSQSTDLVLSPSGRFLFVPSQASQSVHVYSVDSTSGILTEISGSPFAMPPNSALSVDPTERFLYAGSATNATMSVYSIDPSSGTLTQINGSPFTAGQGATSLALMGSTPSPGSTLTTLQVTPATATVAAGLSQRFMALATLSDGTTEFLNASSTWSSSNSSVATVDATGNATSLQAGTTTISATSGGVSGSATLSVGPATLVSLAITPVNPSTPLGQAQQFVATGTFTDGSTQNLSSSVSWSSSAPAVSTISSTGLASAATQGIANISATLGTVSATTSLTVGAPQIASFSIAPVNPSIYLGQSLQFSATANYTDGTTQDATSYLVWQSLQPTVATINANAYASSVSAGTAQISALIRRGSMLLGVASTTLTVGPPLLVSLSIAPASPAILPGATQQFTALGTFTDGSQQNLTSAVSWASSPANVATISNATGSQGLATGTATGNSNITATSGTIIASASMAVNFATSGNLNTARYEHTATFLNNGMVLMAGGNNGTSSSASAELYNPTTTNFTTTGSLITSRYNHTATLLNNGMVLLVGGYNSSSGFLASAELYNPATDTFTSTGSLVSARYYQTATVLNSGLVLIVGGYNSSGPLASAELYNPTTGTFTPTGNLNTARYVHTATLLDNGMVLIVGGAGPSGVLASSELYDPATGMFSASGDLNIARYAHTGTLLNNGHVMIAGGYGFNGYLADAELYDPTTGMFSSTGNLNTARFYQTATLLSNGMVLMVGGYGNGGYLASSELFDPVAGIFTPTGSLNIARGYNTATILNNGMVLIAGGYGNNSAALTLAELYEPPSLMLPNLVSIAVTPANPFVQVGASQTFVAMGTSSDSSTQILQSVTWSSSTPSVAPISNDSTNLGTAAALANGSSTMTACDGSICGSTTLTTGAPVASLSTSSLTFANQNLGSNSTVQSVTLIDTGTMPLTITALTVTGANPGDFSLTSTCPISPATLGTGTNCTINVVFSPSATGSRSASISIMDNAAGSPQSVSLSGTGTLPSITLTPATLAFGNQVINTTSAVKTITLSNPGSGTLNISSIAITGANLTEFAQTNTCGTSVGPSGTCKISVTFTPATAAAKTASVTVTDNSSGSPHSVSLTGTGLLPFTATPSPLAFGNQGMGSTSAVKTVTLTNNTSGAIALSSSVISGTNATDFSKSATTCGASLATKASCTISITFTPSISGAETAALTITDGAANSPQSVSLTGTGVAQATTSVATLAFGNQGLNSTSAASTLTLTNNDSTAITLSGNAISGPNASAFAVSATTCSTSLAGHASCTISVKFTPTATGPMTATLNITDSATNSPQTVALTGTGVQQVTLSAATLAFGNEGIGSPSAVKSVTVTNNNGAAITVSSPAISGTNATDFAPSTTTCGASIAAHASCTVSVTFTPSTLLAETATLNITDSATNSPQTVALTGTGMQQVTLSAATLAFGNEGIGSPSAVKSVTVTNNNGAAITVSSPAISGTNATDFAPSATTCGASIAAHASCTVSVTFTPSTLLAETATLTITDSATNSPQTVALTGTGVQQVTLSAATLAFGNQAISTTSTAKSITITNNNGAAITISSPAISGANATDFAPSATTCGASIAAHASCTVSVTFTPSTLLAETATLTIADGATNSPQTVSLSGTGIVQVSVTPASLTYASQTVGTTSAAKTVTVKNNLASTLTSLSLTFTGTNAGDFLQSATTCGTSLATGASCTVSVEFKPSATGARSANLSVTDSASTSPQTATLSGTGK
jgi:6-phosphogluconolactonase (cycloisomerase 2 family)